MGPGSATWMSRIGTMTAHWTCLLESRGRKAWVQKATPEAKFGSFGAFGQNDPRPYCLQDRRGAAAKECRGRGLPSAFSWWIVEACLSPRGTRGVIDDGATEALLGIH